MQETAQEKSQINLRMPTAALEAINEGASREGKSTADYLRIAGLTAACHTLREIPTTVFMAPGENVTLSRAQALGLTPVADVGGEWQGEVRAQIGKNGFFHDKAGGIWTLTPEGLKLVMGFAPSEEAERLEVLSKMRERLESRSPYLVTQAFTASIVPGEGYPLGEHVIRKDSTLFADPDFWKGKLYEGQEVVRFFFNITPLFVDRKTFLNCARKTSLHG